MNDFIKHGLMEAQETVSGNGALKYSTSLNTFVDDFASTGTYMNRSYDEVSETMEKEWSLSPEMTLRMIGYIRIITRKENHIYKTKSVQRGQGLRNEYYYRMMWLASNHPKVFYGNLPIFIEIGSPRDLFELLRRDYTQNGWNGRQLNWKKMSMAIRLLLQHPNTKDLVLKFLPTPRTNKKATTERAKANNVIAHWFAHEMQISMSEYRALKSSGNAHTWQQQIAREEYQEIDFSKVPSGALSSFVHPRNKVHKLRKRYGKKVLVSVTGDGTTFLERHGLEDNYLKWVETQDTVNSTEYPHVILKDLQDLLRKHIPRVTETTINKKFEKLLETARDGVDTNSRFIAVRDTSGSMGATVPGMGFSADHVAKSMALFMSQFLEGPFKDTYIEFNSKATMRKFDGDSYVAKYVNDNHHFIGNTDFLDVAQIFVRAKRDGVPESEMPTGIVCFSDGEFDPAKCWGIPQNHKGNFATFLLILRDAGFSEEFVDNFKIILWDIPNGYYQESPKVKFESSADTPNFFYIGGFDPSVISFLMGGKYEEKPKAAPRTAEELMQAALNQEILDKLVVQ